MKKVITLVLALALVLTSVVAIAESVEAPAAPKGTPNINTFATMKVKYVGGMFNNNNPHVGANNYYEITLSKPVDRLLVKWAEKGAEPEELAVDENLQATAIAWGHKYMPGTFQYYATWVDVNQKVTYDATVLGYDVENSETVYNIKDKFSGHKDHVAFEYQYVYPEVVLDPNAPISIEDQIASYKAEFVGADEDYIIVLPFEYVDATGKTIKVNGSIKLADKTFDGIDPESIQTVIATPDQTAFMTVQGEWAVYYNRAGKIVGIEYFEGQF